MIKGITLKKGKQIAQNIPKLITDQQNEALQKQPIEEEVKKVIFIMELDKAPRPDGFSVGFFLKNYEIVGKDV